MHINVNHINAGEVGDSAEFEIQGEYPDIPDIDLAEPLSGRIQLIKLDSGLQLSGQARIVAALDCYRCLEGYEYQTDLSLSGFFSQNPEEDQWRISAKGEIDLEPLISQELLLSIPMKQLCSQDCLGLCVECSRRLDDQHSHQSTPLTHKPRIVNKRG